MKKLLVLTLVLLLVAGCSAPTLKVGLGMVSGMSGADATAEKEGKTQADVTACAATFDAKGKIVGVQFDVIQAKAAITTAGGVKVSEGIKSKKELGPDYNMKGASPIGKEWFEQIAAFEAYCVGKTAEAVAGMAVIEVNNHTNVPDVAELKSSCTMSCGDFFASLTEAYANAK